MATGEERAETSDAEAWAVGLNIPCLTVFTGLTWWDAGIVCTWGGRRKGRAVSEDEDL